MSAAPTALVVPVLVTHPFRGGLTFGNGPTGLSCVPRFVSVLSEHNRKPAPVFITLGEPQAHEDTTKQAAEKRTSRVGWGFIPGTNVMKVSWALAPEVRLSILPFAKAIDCVRNISKAYLRA
jgi:hypothetical protein